MDAARRSVLRCSGAGPRQGRAVHRPCPAASRPPSHALSHLAGVAAPPWPPGMPAGGCVPTTSGGGIVEPAAAAAAAARVWRVGGSWAATAAAALASSAVVEASAAFVVRKDNELSPASGSSHRLCGGRRWLAGGWGRGLDRKQGIKHLLNSRGSGKVDSRRCLGLWPKKRFATPCSAHLRPCRSRCSSDHFEMTSCSHDNAQSPLRRSQFRHRAVSCCAAPAGLRQAASRKNGRGRAHKPIKRNGCRDGLGRTSRNCCLRCRATSAAQRTRCCPSIDRH